jgi:cytochrome c553
MQRWLRRIGIVLGGAAGLLGVAAMVVYVWSERVIDRHYSLPTAMASIPQDAASIVEGRRLATVYGCMDGCHGKQGRGVLFFDVPAIARLNAPNLSVAARRYSEPQLVNIIRSGLRPDGTSVFVMPSQSFAAMTDQDVGRIVAFLKTLPPIEGPGAHVSLGPIGRFGIITGRFKTAAQEIAEGRTPAPARTALAERGRYLARTICTECHGAVLQGDSNPDFTSPDLRIVAAYSAGDFTRLMRTGTALGGRELGIMRTRAQNNLSHLTDEEIAALYEYLHTLTAN